MAAVIVPTTTDRAPERAPSRARPTLRIIEGGRSAPQVARRRVYLRRRIGAVTLLVLVAVVGWLAVLGVRSLVGEPPATPSTSAATAAVPPAAAEEYVVRPGDTLWVIARQLRPEGEIRPVVDELADRAGGPDLSVGQRIDIRGVAD
jgi:hypothetical protein